jgi:glycosyltransferase involved in cell wall biosynthesis
MTAPRFSVIIPTWNRERVLPIAVRSVLAQTIDDFELIVVDDGSTDRTHQVVDAFRDARIRYVALARSGVCAARNAGAEIARGTFLVFLDSDDELVPEALEKFANSIAAHAWDVVVSGRVSVSPDRRDWRTLIPKRLGFLPGAFAIRSTLFAETGGYDVELRYGENTELQWRVRRLIDEGAGTMGLVPEPLVVRYTRATRPYDLARYEAATRILERQSGLLESDVAGTLPPRKRRATYQAIAAVNAAQLGRRREALRLVGSAIKSDPFSLARYRNLLTVLGARSRNGSATDVSAPENEAVRRDHAIGELHGIVVTFNRPESLRQVLQDLKPVGLESLTIVDNAPSDATKAVVEAASLPISTTYVEMPENSGPAGGYATGMTRVVEFAGDDDWILLLDDDRMTGSAETARALRDFGSYLRDRDAPVGAVGQIGARFDRRRGRLERLSDEELAGPVTVDYIAGGQMLTLSVAAVRAVGVFDQRLFFGFDDLDFCQRLQRAGYGIYAYGPAGLDARRRFGRLGPDVGRARRRESAWRRYYSVRNHIVMMRRYAPWPRAVIVSLGHLFGRPCLDLVRGQAGWATTIAGTRGCIDAWLNRLGRRIDPTSGT